MGGEGPYVKFNENYRLGGLASRPYPLDDKELDAAYTRAHDFLLKRVRQLVELGWEQHETDGMQYCTDRPVRSSTDDPPDSSLASLSYTRILTSSWGPDQQSRVELRLPRTASAWFDPFLVPQWIDMLTRSSLFNARRRRWNSSASDRYANTYLYVDVEPPLRDVFNFLQCLIPDTLVIIRVDDIDDIGEEETTQRLPSSKWVEDYAGELCPILGEERFKDVARASHTCACLSRMVSSYLDDEYEADDRDFTACDKECGYCGRCEY